MQQQQHHANMGRHTGAKQNTLTLLQVTGWQRQTKYTQTEFEI